MKRFFLSLFALVSLNAVAAEYARADESAECSAIAAEVKELADEVVVFATTSLTQTRSCALNEFSQSYSDKYRSAVNDLSRDIAAHGCEHEPSAPHRVLENIIRELGEVNEYTSRTTTSAGAEASAAQING